MKQLIYVTVIASLGALAQADTRGLMHGTVTLYDDSKVSGVLRFGDEEVLWVDHFNGRYDTLPDLAALSADDREAFEDNRPGPIIQFDDHVVELSTIFGREELKRADFEIEFGTIRSLTMKGGDRVMVTLRDGSTFDADGGSNDIDTDIQLINPGGEREFDWDDIKRIDFSAAPSEAVAFDDLIQGEIVADGYRADAVMTWDNDERLARDKLDGDKPDGEDVSIEFGELRRVERVSRLASNVTTKDGTTWLLSNSNDIDDDHRGLWHHAAGFGTVMVPWHTVNYVEFRRVDNGLPGYDDFADTGLARGSLHLTDGSEIAGEIGFGLADWWSANMLFGNDGELERYVPIRLVSAFEIDGSAAHIELKNGQLLTLDPIRLVDQQRMGVLVRSGESLAWKPWDEIEKISYDTGATLADL